MTLPQAFILRRDLSSARPRGGARRHLLVLALIAGCGANHAIFRYGQEVQAKAANDRLQVLIELDNGQAVESKRYLDMAREYHGPKK